ncbi:glutathione synthase [Chryseobacterium sediminis]|uniref:Glutathione synthase n=1 Tax=Chryseobacterium sediminis TaxID=1679494 RepID=A0A5B2UDX7_9FLAO|nr:glutathione synthase [Chryseobacterium sediminis]KAA2224578.1 glutathione synthase [Chryseobacterium sediminis]
MAQRIFNKEDFTKSNEKEYQLEYDINEIGKGSDLIVERLTEKGDYEIVQAPLRRLNDKIFIIWDTPFDGRILFDL